MTTEQNAMIPGAEAQGATPPEPSPVTQAPSAKDQLGALLETLGDDDIAEVTKHPKLQARVNAEAQRINDTQLKRERRKIQDEFRQEQTRVAEARGFVNYVDTLRQTNPAQIANLSLTQPDFSQRYQQAKAIAQNITPAAEMYSQSLITNFGKVLVEAGKITEDEYADLTSKHADDGVEWLEAIVDNRTGKERKQMEKELDAKFKAFENEMRAKYLQAGSEPEVLPAGAQRGSGSGHVYTTAELQNMGKVEYESRREDILKARKEGRIKER